MRVLFSAGLGIPFLATGIFLSSTVALFGKVKKYLRAVSLVGGVLLIVIGVLIATGLFEKVNQVFVGA